MGAIIAMQNQCLDLKRKQKIGFTVKILETYVQSARENCGVNRMREIKVKVPDETIYMHVVVGVKENECMVMYTGSDNGKHDMNIGELEDWRREQNE